MTRKITNQINKSNLKGLDFGLNRRYIQLINFFIDIFCITNLHNLFLFPCLSFQVLCVLDNLLLLLFGAQILLFYPSDEFIGWGGGSFQTGLVGLAGLCQIVCVLGLVCLLADKQLGFCCLVKGVLFLLELLPVLLSELQILHAFHLITLPICIISHTYQRRALDSLLNLIPLLQIDLRPEIYLNFLGVFLAPIFQLLYLIPLFNLFLFLLLFLLFQDLVEHRPVVLVHLLGGSVDWFRVGGLVAWSLKSGFLELFHVLVEFFLVDRLV